MTRPLEKNLAFYEEAILIRNTENILLDLFTQGKLNGTIHTCNGQEFSGIAISHFLEEGDTIFSNHRCHGHYLSKTKDLEGLIAELMGKSSGASGGIGSSQHLINNGFFSNGIQGGIVPVSAGIAFANKFSNNNKICVVYIGDGTLGEGVVYETMNIASLINLPLLIVCENNSYAQSTKIEDNLSGDILDRAKAFNLKTFHSNTWDIDNLFENAKKSIASARENIPTFHLIDTYRLNHHSKSDDNRDIKEVKKYYDKDPLVIFEKDYPQRFKKIHTKTLNRIHKLIDRVSKHNELNLIDYFFERKEEVVFKKISLDNPNERVVQRINSFFHHIMDYDKKTIIIGEDILSPYGGAFKVCQDLSLKFPNRVISSPISEAAIAGISNGLAISGYKPYLEIMFGDFITLAFDQILNHASKFHHMYNKKVSCPIVIRAPMGGGRGYGPTHSQTLDKFLVGIDNVKVLAINSLIDPFQIYSSIHKYEEHPVIVIENKVDYGRFLFQFLDGSPFSFEQSSNKYPILKFSPKKQEPSLTIISYGGISRDVVDLLENIFVETDLIPEVFVLTQISPLDISCIVDSVSLTKKIITIEEGSKNYGIGSEIIVSISEQIGSCDFLSGRIAALPVPIASSSSLESYVLPNSRIIENLKKIISKW